MSWNNDGKSQYEYDGQQIQQHEKASNHLSLHLIENKKISTYMPHTGHTWTDIWHAITEVFNLLDKANLNSNHIIIMISIIIIMCW